MKTFNGILAAVAAAGLAIAPAVASAENAAAKLSISPNARAAAPAGKSKLGASVPGTTLISIGILAALTAIVLVATKEGSPKSP